MASLPAVEATPDRIWIKINNYTRLTDIFGILWQEIKDLEGTVVSVLAIKVDTNLFNRAYPTTSLTKHLSLQRRHE